MEVFITSLPDEILEMLFELTHDIEDIISYSQVCHRWRLIAQRRLAQINYLISYHGVDPTGPTVSVCVTPPCRVGKLGRKIILYNRCCENERLLTYLTVLPNLKFIKAVKNLTTLKQAFEHSLSKKEHLVGLFTLLDGPKTEEKSKILKRIEMIYPMFCEPSELCFDTLKTLHVGWDWDLIYYKFRNIRRVRIERYKGKLVDSYTGPKLDTIEMMELFVDRNCNLGPTLSLCPRLKSLFLLLHRITDRFFPKSTIESLENLVLEYYDEDKADTLSICMAFLRCFPNLKNLAIRLNGYIKSYEVSVILETFPNLETLDLRGCYYVNESIEEICSQFAANRGKSLSYFYGKCPYLPKDPVNNVLCLSFDFMKHIFFKRYEDAPMFLMDEK